MLLTPQSASGLKLVNPTGQEACSEAVVDIDDAYTARTAVEHCEQSRKSVEVGTVADTCGHCDNGCFDKAADHAG